MRTASTPWWRLLRHGRRLANLWLLLTDLTELEGLLDHELDGSLAESNEAGQSQLGSEVQQLSSRVVSLEKCMCDIVDLRVQLSLSTVHAELSREEMQAIVSAAGMPVSVIMAAFINQAGLDSQSGKSCC